MPLYKQSCKACVKINQDRVSGKDSCQVEIVQSKNRVDPWEAKEVIAEERTSEGTSEGKVKGIPLCGNLGQRCSKKKSLKSNFLNSKCRWK